MIIRVCVDDDIKLESKAYKTRPSESNTRWDDVPEAVVTQADDKIDKKLFNFFKKL